jgi:hypothetical protein
VGGALQQPQFAQQRRVLGEMAVRDPKTRKLVVDEVEVQIVKVNVREIEPRLAA